MRDVFFVELQKFSNFFSSPIDQIKFTKKNFEKDFVFGFRFNAEKLKFSSVSVRVSADAQRIFRFVRTNSWNRIFPLRTNFESIFIFFNQSTGKEVVFYFSFCQKLEIIV